MRKGSPQDYTAEIGCYEQSTIHYIGLDVHKKTISYCIKAADGQFV
jgi:hypothetical protein